MNSLKQTSRSQSLSALASQPQPLKRNAMSNSTMSLSSPNKDINSNGKNQLADSESDDDESFKSTEESSESDEEESKCSSQTKQSSENQSSYLDDDYDDDDDDAVRVHRIKSTAKKQNEADLETGKRSAPVPQVRFSKLVNHMKK